MKDINKTKIAQLIHVTDRCLSNDDMRKQRRRARAMNFPKTLRNFLPYGNNQVPQFSHYYDSAVSIHPH